MAYEKQNPENGVTPWDEDTWGAMDDAVDDHEKRITENEANIEKAQSTADANAEKIQENTDLIDSLSGWSGTNSSRTVAFKTSMQIQFLLIGGYDWLYLVYFNLNNSVVIPMEIYSTDAANPPVTVEYDTVRYQVKVTRNSSYAGWFIASPSCQIEVS